MTDGKKYQVHLNNFDGPMDLLLHLIDKNKMDIYDIPIAEITEQYIHFLDEAREMDLEIASEFTLTAATLLYIKAKMLLPKRKRGEEEEEEDPRAELVQRLVEYRFYKEMAHTLQEKELEEDTFMLKEQDIERLTGELEPGNPVENITIRQLFRAFREVMEQVEEETPEIEMSREEFLIEDCIEEIRTRLKEEEGLEFSALFRKKAPKRQIITIFMALLELCKLGELTFQQKNNFGSLWIFSR